MGWMAYDRGRLDQLRAGLNAALDELQTLRCDDPEAADAMRVVGEACRIIGDRCLPRVRDLLTTDPMTAPSGASAASCQFRSSPLFELTNDLHWELAEDPRDLNGAPLRTPLPHTDETLPWNRSYDDVMNAIDCGELTPLAMPKDPHRPAAAQATVLQIAPGATAFISEKDITSSGYRFVDFLSDASPIGYRDRTTKDVYYVSSAVVTATVQVFDPQSGERFPAQVSEAVVSGYLVVRERNARWEVNVGLKGDESDDPTNSLSVPLQTEHEYSGTFYPEAPVEFTPVAEPPPDRNQAWTFVQSEDPVIDGLVGNWERV